jgi:two-component system NarL family response regulator
VADDDEHVFEAIKNGASGYLTKNLAADELCQLLQGLSRGEVPLSPGLAGRVLREFANQPPATQPETTPRLSERQHEILTLVAQGHTYKQVGHLLNYSEATIKYHMGVVIKRLHLRNRADAVDYVRRQMADGVWPDLSPGAESEESI